MKTVLFVLLFSLASVGAMAQSKWSLDKSHAKLRFSVSHMMLSEVEGAFNSFDVKMTSTKEDLSDAQIELSADVNSIDTDNADRDKHLKQPDFFDAAKFSTLAFKGKSFRKASGKNYKLSGDLTMHGVTKPVTLDVIYNGTAVNPHSKKTMAGFKVTGTLKRTDFAVGKETPSAMVGDEITITSNFEMSKD